MEHCSHLAAISECCPLTLTQADPIVLQVCQVNRVCWYPAATSITSSLHNSPVVDEGPLHCLALLQQPH